MSEAVQNVETYQNEQTDQNEQSSQNVETYQNERKTCERRQEEKRAKKIESQHIASSHRSSLSLLWNSTFHFRTFHFSPRTFFKPCRPTQLHPFPLRQGRSIGATVVVPGASVASSSSNLPSLLAFLIKLPSL